MAVECQIIIFSSSCLPDNENLSGINDLVATLIPRAVKIIHFIFGSRRGLMTEKINRFFYRNETMGERRANT